MDERAARISLAIEKSGLSYPELEKITGVSKSSLQRYATGGTKKIPIECIENIEEATGTDARYLMGWDSEPISTAIHMINPCIQTNFSHFIAIMLYFVLHRYKLHNASISILCIYTNIEFI